jgi:hypothetical protein
MDNASKEYKVNEDTKVQIIKESSAMCGGFRPLVLSNIDDSVTVGGAFAATLSIQPCLDLSRPFDSGLAVEDPYNVKKQLDFLAVRAMPIGALSSVEDVQQRTLEMLRSKKGTHTKTVSNSRDSVVVKAEAPAVALPARSSASSVTGDAAPQSHDKTGKKHKKNKEKDVETVEKSKKDKDKKRKRDQ